MKLKSLEIKNLRCFEAYKIDFTPKTTIIIGRNGAGKSTLIDAIKIAMSFIFSNNKKLGKDFLSAGNPSLNVNTFADTDFRYDSEQGTTAPDASVKGLACYNGRTLEWELYKRSTSNASLYTTKYQKAFDAFMDEWKNKGADLPLIACFSDSFPHKATKQTSFAINSILKDKMQRNFGYYQWNLDTACTSVWENRLCNQLAHIAPMYGRAESSATFATLHDEIEYVQNRLVRLSQRLPKLTDEQYDIDYLVAVDTGRCYELSIVFKNGRSKLLSELPAGYCRLYSIVLDLAYRAYILNGNKEPSGIVLIDEIDLHLHPSLEQEVVQCLGEIFPQVQFIMTSHSAAVIANLDTTEMAADVETGEPVRANQVVFMQDGQTEADVLPVIYGLDYNAALRDFMGSDSRNAEMKKKGDEYLTYCSLGMEKEAQSIISRMTEALGAEHNYVKELKEKAKAYEIH